MSRISAVVVHWRDPAATLACLASLAREPEIDVLVVDNGSRHPLAVPPGVRCVRSEENRGYAGGANLGIRDALARRAEVVLLLNDDVRVHPGAACSALRVLDRDPRVAAVGAKVLAREDPQRLWLAWGRVTYRQSLVALCGAGELDGPAYAEERDVEWIAGCAMWLRARALAAVGLFDEEFFAYHEEVEWCARARAAGWRVVYCPDAVVTHGGRGTSKAAASVRVRKYFTARNMVLYARRHASPVQRAKLACFLVGTLPLQLLWNLPRGRAGEVVLKMRGVRDALTGRRPPFEALGLR
ncbi:MAG: glycosyltransferase family 2 protein [Deltaproteobacteria bacterium]|nr:MAG: glycosyltransferase family 2 protein [Deltaproteobacteria bacterium]